jgi:predicted dehydrogenase
MRKFNVGLVGCGMIRKPYLQACAESQWLSLAACADLQTERAAQAAREYAEKGLPAPRVCTFDEMLADKQIDLIMNITNPRAHFPINIRALEAGKHVHAEKPLCITREEGKQMIRAARKNRVRLSCAPDTFLGSGHQTARALIDRGDIGVPTAVSLFFVGGGPDGYHEDPELFFQAGAGPMFDVGVYILTAAVNLLGPIKRVCGFSKITFPERTVLSQKKYGQKFRVEVPTHVTASLEFASGVLGTMVTSFDMKGGNHLPRIEVYGTEGTLVAPDPNGFGGKSQILRTTEQAKGWQDIEPAGGYGGKSRGIGAADLSAAVQNKRPQRAGIDLSYHVLDVGLSILESAERGKAVNVRSKVERPQPLSPSAIVADIVD